jgi:hypothetical protein
MRHGLFFAGLPHHLGQIILDYTQPSPSGT